MANMSRIKEAARNIGKIVGLKREPRKTEAQLAIEERLTSAQELLTKQDFTGADFNKFIEIVMDNAVGENNLLDSSTGISYAFYRCKDDGWDFGSIEICPSWTVDQTQGRKSTIAIAQTLTYGERTDFTNDEGTPVPYVNYSLMPPPFSVETYDTMISFYSHIEGKSVQEKVKVDNMTQLPVGLEQTKKVCKSVLDVIKNGGKIVQFKKTTDHDVPVRVRSTLQIQIENNDRWGPRDYR